MVPDALISCWVRTIQSLERFSCCSLHYTILGNKVSYELKSQGELQGGLHNSFLVKSQDITKGIP